MCWVETFLGHCMTDLVTGAGVVYNLGRSLTTKVASFIANNEWQWPRRRNTMLPGKFRTILQVPCFEMYPRKTVFWNLNGNGQSSIKSALQALVKTKPTVTW